MHSSASNTHRAFLYLSPRYPAAAPSFNGKCIFETFPYRGAQQNNAQARAVAAEALRIVALGHQAGLVDGAVRTPLARSAMLTNVSSAAAAKGAPGK